MGGKREYTAIFAIGAKLLGSFKGAMSAAQSRLHALQRTAMSVGRSIASFGARFSALFAGLAAFGLGAIFKKIFEGADQAAEDADTRTRRLTAGLDAQAKFHKQGADYIHKQVGEISEANEKLSKQGVVSKELLDASASQLAIRGLGPKQIVESTKALADMLVATKGVNATMEDMNTLSSAFGKALRGGKGVMALQQFGITLTKPEQKLLLQKAKVNDLKGAYDFLMKRVLAYAGNSAKALKTPEGRIHALDNMIKLMQLHIGEASKESRAKMADAWRGLLPEIEPFLLQAKIMTSNAMAAIANYIRVKGVPALKALSAWAKGPGAAAWTKIKDAWHDMAGKIGKALSDQFHSLAGSGKTLGDVVVKAMEGIAKLFKWIGDNAPTIVRVVEGLTAAFVAMSIVDFAAVNLGLLAILGTVGLLATAYGKASSAYQNYLDLLAKKPGTVVDPDMYVTHWYLLGHTWTDIALAWKSFCDDFVAGLKRIGQWVEHVKKLWQEFKDMLSKFHMPASVDRFFKHQTEMNKPAAAAAAAEQAAGAKADAERAAAQAKAWRDAGGARPRGAWAQANAPPAGFDTTPRFGAPPIPIKAPLLLRPPEAGGMANWQLAVQNVMTSAQRAFDNWHEGAAQIAFDSQSTIPPALDVTGNAIRNNVMAPIQDAAKAWSDLATQMQTPITPAEPPAGPALPAHQFGGIFRSHHLAHIAERGPEAVIPLSGGARARGLLAHASHAIGGGGGGVTSVNFAPSITINGNASASEQAALDSKLRDLARDFVEDFKRAQYHERRLSYEGGYG